jgi:hypothetical protein
VTNALAYNGTKLITVLKRFVAKAFGKMSAVTKTKIFSNNLI